MVSPEFDIAVEVLGDLAEMITHRDAFSIRERRLLNLVLNGIADKNKDLLVVAEGGSLRPVRVKPRFP